MNPGPLVFLATFLAVATSWFSFVLMPQLQFGRQGQDEAKDTGLMYPPHPPGLAAQGQQIYRANGCNYCHTQQVRPRGYGGDVDRNWGARSGKVQSVAEDYLYRQPVMLGSERVGPDLANIGARQISPEWHFRHLYDPTLTTAKSLMPPYKYLFETKNLKPGQKRSPDALTLSGPQYGNIEVVPTDQAKALVAYLLSLREDAGLFEAPLKITTNAVPAGAAGTNAPATTNAPAPAK